MNLENDELITTLEGGHEEQSQSLDDGFVDLIVMADKIDRYYVEYGISN